MKKLFLLGAMVCALGVMTACKSGTADTTVDSIAMADSTNLSEQLSPKPTIIKVNGKYGLADKDGNVILEPAYSAIYEWEDEYYKIFTEQHRQGLVDRNGHIILKPEYNSFGYLQEGLRLVDKDGQCGYADKHGNFVIPLKWTFGDDFKDGKAYVELGDSSYYIDKQGKIISCNTDDWEQDFGHQEE
ncbi:MAG: WG repeat-containing protein [Bacteroidales bacterium]|nr:WG repeat-containing protein [Bacteroidales bacterium]